MLPPGPVASSGREDPHPHPAGHGLWPGHPGGGRRVPVAGHRQQGRADRARDPGAGPEPADRPGDGDGDRQQPTSGDVVVVQVHLATSDRLADAGSGWSLVVSGDTSARAPVTVPPGAGPAVRRHGRRRRGRRPTAPWPSRRATATGTWPSPWAPCSGSGSCNPRYPDRHARAVRPGGHRRWSGRLRRRALRRQRRPEGGVRREGQGGRHVPAPRVASRPRSSWRRRRSTATSPGPRSSASRPASPRSTSRSARPASRRSSTTSARACPGLMKSRKIDVYNGAGSLGADRIVTVQGDDGTDRHAAGHHVVLAAGSAPRTHPRLRRRRPRSCSPPTRCSCSTSCPRASVVIGGGAIGCEFASTFSDLGAKVTILEALPKILPGLRQRRGQRRRALVQEAGHRRSARAPRCVGHEPHGQRHEGARSRGRAASRPTPSSCRSAAARTPTCSGSTGTAVQGRPSGASWRSTSGAAPASPASTPSATCPRRPQLAHVGFAEAIMVVKDILGEQPAAGRLRQGAVGDLLPPRGRLRRLLRGGGQATPASTS